MKERSLPLPGGCWKLRSIRLQARRRESAGWKVYDGRQVAGMDLHRRRSVLVRMAEDERRLGTVKITNSPAALRKEIARAGQHPKVVLEATYGWSWAADTLAAARGGAPGPPAGGEGVHLPPGQEQRAGLG